MDSAVLVWADEPTTAAGAAAPGTGGGGGAGGVVRVKRSVLAGCLTCPLCGRLLRDAATITECLHTFCRKCIFEEFINKEVCYCPTCSIALGCAPLEKLRVDHSLQYVRSKIFPFKKQKVETQEVTSPFTSPIKRKERSLSLLTIHAPQVSMQKCLTKRRTKASCLRNLSLGTSGVSSQSPTRGTVMPDDSTREATDDLALPGPRAKKVTTKRPKSSIISHFPISKRLSTEVQTQAASVSTSHPELTSPVDSASAPIPQTRDPASSASEEDPHLKGNETSISIPTNNPWVAIKALLQVTGTQVAAAEANHHKKLETKREKIKSLSPPVTTRKNFFLTQ